MPATFRTRLVQAASPALRPLIRAGNGRRATATLRRLRGLLILAYHEVGASIPGWLPPALVTSTSRFDEEMRWLKAQMEVVRLDEGLERLCARELDDPLAAVTFDDGFAGVARNAYPVLARLKIPATVFLNGSFYAGREISPRVKAEFVAAHGAAPMPRAAADGRGRPADVFALVKSLGPRNAGQLDQEYRACGGQFDPSLHLHETDVRAMSPELMQVGNHGYHHWRMAGLSPEEQAREALDSDALLTGLPHYRRLFAPPFGTMDSIDAHTRTLAVRAYGGQLVMLGGGINRQTGGKHEIVVRNAVADNKPSLTELVWLNVLSGRR